MSVIASSLTPKLSPDIYIANKGSKFLFLSPSHPEWIVTNSNGALALAMCDGKSSVNVIQSKIVEQTGVDFADKAIQFLYKIYNSTRLFAPLPLKIHEARDPSQVQPGTVHLNLTDACNLRCTYCYVDARAPGGKPNKDRTFDLPRYKQIIDEFIDLSPGVRFMLTGGEALLAKSVDNLPLALELARYIRQRGAKCHLLTNGILLRPEHAREFSDLCELIQISIDGSSPLTHDILRGRGTFTKVHEAVSMLEQHGAAIQISVTVTKKNIHDLAGIVARFGSRVIFQPLFKSGGGKVSSDLYITGQEYYDALSSIPSVNPLEGIHTTLQNARVSPSKKCALGDNSLSMSPAGDLYPCHLLHLDEFKIGSIANSGVKEVLSSSARFKKVLGISVDTNEGCATCEVRNFCGGTCRARIYFETGKIDGYDKFCDYERKAIVDAMFDDEAVTP